MNSRQEILLKFARHHPLYIEDVTSSSKVVMYCGKVRCQDCVLMPACTSESDEGEIAIHEVEELKKSHPEHFI
jgi:hypothetical protein